MDVYKFNFRSISKFKSDYFIYNCVAVYCAAQRCQAARMLLKKIRNRQWQRQQSTTIAMMTRVIYPPCKYIYFSTLIYCHRHFMHTMFDMKPIRTARA